MIKAELSVPVVSVEPSGLYGSIIAATRVRPDPVEGDIFRGGDRCKPNNRFLVSFDNDRMSFIGISVRHHTIGLTGFPPDYG